MGRILDMLYSGSEFFLISGSVDEMIRRVKVVKPVLRLQDRFCGQNMNGTLTKLYSGVWFQYLKIYLIGMSISGRRFGAAGMYWSVTVSVDLKSSLLLLS